jgi:hypothetical protein
MYVGDLLTTCFGPKGPFSSIIVTKKSYWVVSGLYINGISFVQLIGLYRTVIGVCVCACVYIYIYIDAVCSVDIAEDG